MSEKLDCVVIGSGPGGYAAAIRCAQKGLLVGLVEKGQLGGTCLNRGCIPSKALLGSAHTLLKAGQATLMGVEIGSIKADWEKIQARKNTIVTNFRKGLAGLLRANRIKLFEARAIVKAPGKVQVETENSIAEINAKKIILATGSQPASIPAVPFDGKTVITSKEALCLDVIPESMVIIGGGAIGCELGCVYAAVGTKVTIIEALDRLLPNEDAWVGRILEREFKKLGIESLTGQKVTAMDISSGIARLSTEGGGKIEAEKVMVAVGRKAVCDKETVEAIGLKMNGSAIDVNKKMETNVNGVYAIGDAAGTTYLAHGAFSEAEIAAENAVGGDKETGDYSLIPRAVYSFPQVASVGSNETQLSQQGIEFAVGRAFFRANGKSTADNETTGEVRVVKAKATGEVLGVTMVGASVTEMVSTARALLGSKEKITNVPFAHPTVSEVLKEAWEDAFGVSLHVPPKL